MNDFKALTAWCLQPCIAESKFIIKSHKENLRIKRAKQRFDNFNTVFHVTSDTNLALHLLQPVSWLKMRLWPQILQPPSKWQRLALTNILSFNLSIFTIQHTILSHLAKAAQLDCSHEVSSRNTCARTPVMPLVMYMHTQAESKMPVSVSAGREKPLLVH